MVVLEKLHYSLLTRLKNVRSLFVFGLLFTSISTTLHSQELPEITPNQFRPNLIHGGLGTGLVIFTATINYERIVTQHFDKSITATYAKVGYGGFATYAGGGEYWFLQYGILTGKKANHFEASAGPLFDLGDGEIVLPVAFGLGYRRQKPGKPFMLRTGVAFPETLYFGMGLSF